MRFVLTQILAVHWLLSFALVSAAALGADGSLVEAVRVIMPFAGEHQSVAASAFEPVLVGGVAIVFATVAAMFLWTLLMIWLGESDSVAEAHSVSVLAHASAMIAVSALMMLLIGMNIPGGLAVGAIMIAALSASYAAISYEWREQGEVAVKPDLGQAAARMMALGAAHSTVLSNITGRGRSD